MSERENGLNLFAKLGRYRNAIMGIAILWVMVCHSKLTFSSLPVLSSAARFVKSNGFGGVDIFLFLSGYGLYHSLSRSEDPIAFYKRRIKRVLPAYLPVLVIWLLTELPSISVKMLPIALWNNITGFAFWLRRAPAFNWYILALPAFYLIAPVFYQIIKRWGRKGEGYLLLLTLVFDVCFLGNYIMIAISRFTIFALGMIVGKRALEGKTLNWKGELALHLLGGAGWVLLYLLEKTVPHLLWNYGLYWYPFLLISPSCVFLLCRIFDMLEQAAAGRAVCAVCAAVGSCSFEVYLIHIKLFEAFQADSNRVWCALMVLVILLGYAYHKAVSAVTERWFRKRQPAGA